MFRDALYYPHILLPQGDWLTKAILFWETINPIVPYGVEIPAGNITNLLHQAGILDFIRPEEHLEYEDGERFVADFSAFLERPGVMRQLGNKVGIPDTYLIHENKFSIRAKAFLESKGLIQRTGGPWLHLPKEVGRWYMAWLAAALAKKRQLHPITDDKFYHENFLLSQVVPSLTSGRSSVVSYESIVLDRILPVPKKAVPLEKLLIFRNDHRRELLAFTTWLAEAAEKLRKITDKEEMEQKVALIKVQIEEQTLAIKERFKENGIDVKNSSLEILVDFNAGDTPLVLTGTALGTVWGGPLGAAIGAGMAKVLVAGMKVYSRFCKGSINQQSILREYPTAYVFSLEKEL